MTNSIVQEIEDFVEHIFIDVASALAPIFATVVAQLGADLAANAGNTGKLTQVAGQILANALPQVEAAGIQATVGDVLKAAAIAVQQYEASTAPIPAVTVAAPPAAASVTGGA